MSKTRFGSASGGESSAGKKLRGKTCVVTGSSRGIGRATALRLAKEDAEVAVNYRSSEDEARDIADAIENDGGDVCLVKADVSDGDEVERMAEEVRNEFGDIDVLVNNAGVNLDSEFESMLWGGMAASNRS